MSSAVEVEPKDQEDTFNVSKSKRADKLRQYYFPTKENSNPAQQETEKTPGQKRTSVVSNIDPTKLPQVHSTSLGIDLDQLDSTISNNVESFINATLGEIGWTHTPELELVPDFSSTQNKINSSILDDQCLELIGKAYNNNDIKLKDKTIYSAGASINDELLSKIQKDYDYLREIYETVDGIAPKNQLMDRLTEFCKKNKNEEGIRQFGRVCDILRDLTQDLQQMETNYIEKCPENEAFTLISLYAIKHMELDRLTKNHINSFNEALKLINNTKNEKLELLQKFIDFISKYIN